MNRKESQMLAYIAGLFDGEGSVGIYQHGETYKLRVGISMDNPTSVSVIKDMFPEAVFDKLRREVGNDYYRVAFNQYKAYEFLKTIEPFVLIKREQVKVGLAFLAHRRRERAKTYHHPKPCRRCESLTKKIKDLKRVNSVKLHDMRQYRAKPEEVNELLERVETRLRETDEAISAREKDIVHT